MSDQQINLTAELETAYSRTVNALYYANLLARHAEDVLSRLSPEPGKPSLELDFRTSNTEIPQLARTQFALEVTRYALIFALAHFDRFVLDLAVFDALVDALTVAGGSLKGADALAIDSSVRTVRRNRSVAVELDRLVGSNNANVATGIVWFRGLYAIRNCLVHRAGVVGTQDKRLLEGIRWRRLVLTLNGEELHGDLPLRVDAGGRIGVKFDESSRSWNDGERIALTLDELRQMMYSLFQLAGALVQHLNADFAVRLGPPVSGGSGSNN